MRSLLWMLSGLFFLLPLSQAKALSPIPRFAKPAIAKVTRRVGRVEQIRRLITASFLVLPAEKKTSLWEILWKAENKESCENAILQWSEASKSLGLELKRLDRASRFSLPTELKGWGCRGHKILLWDVVLLQKKLPKGRVSLLLEQWKKKLTPPLPLTSRNYSHAHMLSALLKHQKQIPNNYRWMWGIAATQALRARRNQLISTWRKMSKHEFVSLLKAFHQLPQAQKTRVERFFLNVPGTTFVNFLQDGFRKVPGSPLLRNLGMMRLPKEISFIHPLQRVLWERASKHRKQIMRLTLKQWEKMKNRYIRARLAKILELPGAWGVCLQLARSDRKYSSLVPRFLLGAHPGLGMGLLSLLCLSLLLGVLFLLRRLFGIVKTTGPS